MTVLKEGMVGGALNLFFIYKFLRILTTPWENTDAFKLGIIDEKGKILIKKAKLKTIDEKESYTMMHRLVWKLKRLMEKVPFGKSRLASYAAALWLIKEEKNFTGTNEELQESFLSFLETNWKNDALILKENYEGDMNKKSYSNLKNSLNEADKEALKRALAISKWKKAGGKVDKQPENIEKWWGQLTPADRKRAENLAQYKKEKKQQKEEVELDEIAPWKKGNYTVKDQDGKVLGRFKSGAKAQKFVDKIWDEGDYDSLTVELGEEVVYTRADMDEAVLVNRDYKYDGKVIKISKKNFSKVHRDFKSTTKGKETMITYDSKEGTVLVPVEFTEEFVLDEASKLPPHLAKFFDKKGNLKPEVAARIAKGKEKLNWIDVTPKGYGPKEEIDPHAKVMAKKGDSAEEIKKMHPEITDDELKSLFKEEVLEDGTDLIVQRYREVTPGEVDEKKVSKIKFKLKQFKHMKPKKKSSKKSSSSGDREFAFGISRKGGSGTGSGYGKKSGMMFNGKMDEAKGTAFPATIDTLKMIVREKQNQIVMFDKGQARVDLFTASAMVQVYDSLKPKTKKKFEDMIKTKAGFMKSQAFAMKMMEETEYEENIENAFIEEAKSYTGYELYHKDFSSAMQHAYDHAKSKGFVVDKKEIDDKVATGPKKPSSGKTNRYELKAGRKTVFIQVANLDNKRYELNMYIEGKEELSAFSKFITEGRAKQDPDYVPGATDRDHNRTGLRALADAQKKKYSSQDIKSIARKYKQNVADVVGGKTWDWEWIITLMNGLELTYDYGSNTTYIKGWRFDKKKAAIHLAKYGNDHETVRDMQGGGGKVQVTGLETAFEMISEQVKKEGIDIKKASMKDVIKDFQSSDAPQFKGKTDEKKKEMAIAAKLSKEEVEVEESTKEYAKSLEKIANDRALKMLSKSERENLKKIANLLAKEEAEVDEACWKGYKQLGMKKKGNKKVPNCVPEEKEGINEDAPANSVAGGNVNLDPFVKKKRKNAKVETESFGGRKVFVVSPDRFFESRLGKARYARYEKYVGNDKLGEAIRQYGRANPKASIILKNSGNGAMLYLKYGRK